RDQSGSSFQQVALVDLKGLGSDRTAILINGRRVASNPLTGTAAVDLNTIPLAAVDRIEVLTDSASAVYGADAIGGVVNIIMRKEFSGAEVSTGREEPSRDDAYTNRASATFGQAGNSGSVMFSVDYFKRDPVFDGERDYSKVRVSPNPSGGLPRLDVDTVGVSAGGNTGFDKDFTRAFQIGGQCPTDTYIPITEPFGLDGDGCGYGFADISMQTGGIERTSTFLDARYNINTDHTLYMENRFTKSDTFGRYAPAVGFIPVAADAPLNDIGEEFDLFHRFVGHGNRDDNVGITEINTVFGFEGKLGTAMDINYDVFARYYEYNANEEGDTYIITNLMQQAIADGSYNFLNPLDPANSSAIQRTSATLTRDLETEFQHAGFTLDGVALDLPAGKVGWAFGGEWAFEKYKDQFDNFREAGNVTGSAGNSSAAERERYAFFFEAEIPILDTLSLNAAIRYDDFDDFGDEVSPSLSARWEATDWLSVRASWGEGFKAPNLGDIGAALSQSFESTADVVRCNAQGIPIGDCPSSQVDEFTGGNQNLNAEQSESFNFGVVVSPLENLELSLDWWQVEIDDAISTLQLADVLVLESNGQLPPGVFVNRAPGSGGVPGIVPRCSGAIDLTVPNPGCGIVNVFANLATFDVEGLDLRAQYSLSTDVGEWLAQLTMSHYLKYDEQVLPGGEVFERAGEASYPETQANFNLGWSYRDFNVSYTYLWIDEHEGGNINASFDAYDRHDINAVWTSGFGLELALGVRNLTDEDPMLDSVGTGWSTETSAISTELYDVNGRMYTATATWRF
ncbi:MAG: TonB-dependent receptor, partial [Halieaceae bacterium]|nr:TonB-dependent receptor [Halieaceae bacterium]